LNWFFHALRRSAPFSHPSYVIPIGCRLFAHLFFLVSENVFFAAKNCVISVRRMSDFSLPPSFFLWTLNCEMVSSPLFHPFFLRRAFLFAHFAARFTLSFLGCDFPCFFAGLLMSFPAFFSILFCLGVENTSLVLASCTFSLFLPFASCRKMRPPPESQAHPASLSALFAHVQDPNLTVDQKIVGFYGVSPGHAFVVACVLALFDRLFVHH